MFFLRSLVTLFLGLNRWTINELLLFSFLKVKSRLESSEGGLRRWLTEDSLLGLVLPFST
jgi:hypothetical protein